tara:strand:+ start:782 stop:1219 length:438 start_codon:yes stop_codon:yes gene_type:complete
MRSDLNPQKWGLHAWAFLHAVADGAPENPTQEEKAKFQSFFDALPFVLPCTKCRNHLKRKYDSGKRIVYNSKDNLRLDLWALHNLVNVDLGKKEIPFDCCSESYMLDNQKVVYMTIACVILSAIILLLIVNVCSKCNSNCSVSKQ